MTNETDIVERLEDPMTPEEKRWFSRLRRVLRDMPDTVEIQVHQNSIHMNREGAREAEFVRTGHVDNVDALGWFSAGRVYPCSESI